MKSKIVFLSFSISILALMFMVNEPASAADVWTTPAKITRVYPLPDGSIVLTIDNDSNSCSSGSTPKYYQITVGQNSVTSDALKNMLAVALSAFAMNRIVAINFSDTTSNCYVNRLFVQ